VPINISVGRVQAGGWTALETSTFFTGRESAHGISSNVINSHRPDMARGSDDCIGRTRGAIRCLGGACRRLTKRSPRTIWREGPSVKAARAGPESRRSHSDLTLSVIFLYISDMEIRHE